MVPEDSTPGQTLPPRPPDFLIDRVIGGFDDTDVEAGRRLFDESGRQSVVDITTALAGLGKRLDQFSRILDFGCGSARVLRWIPAEPGTTEIHGCDIDEQAIAWCQAHLPEFQFTRNDPYPPLPYADEKFDLVLNHSVFTHIDERMQDLWLAELRRVLKPGGIALLSVHGPMAFGINEDACRFEGPTPAVLRKELERDGILFLTSDTYVGSSFPSFYHTTFHAPWYVFEHWSEWFTVRAYLSHADLGFQDIVLLERDDAESRVRPIAGAGTTRGAPSPEGAGGEVPAGSLSEVNADRFPPVVAAALEHLGRRVTRLESALADKLTEQ